MTDTDQDIPTVPTRSGVLPLPIEPSTGPGLASQSSTDQATAPSKTLGASSNISETDSETISPTNASFRPSVTTTQSNTSKNAPAPSPSPKSSFNASEGVRSTSTSSSFTSSSDHPSEASNSDGVAATQNTSIFTQSPPPTGTPSIALGIHKSSKAVLIGSIISGLIILFVLIIVAFLLWRFRRRRSQSRRVTPIIIGAHTDDSAQISPTAEYIITPDRWLPANTEKRRSPGQGTTHISCVPTDVPTTATATTTSLVREMEGDEPLNDVTTDRLVQELNQRIGVELDIVHLATTASRIGMVGNESLPAYASSDGN